MYYTYILLSSKNGNLYVGYSADLKARFERHNSGKVKSTQAYRPWKLVYYEAYSNKKDATRREKELKLHAAKELLKSKLKYSLETA